MLEHIPDTYEIIGKIGSGKSGDVYKAYHKNLRTFVVLKKVKTEIKDFVNKRAEVDVLKRLQHSGLPQVYDFLEVDGDVYTVMTFVEGNSFGQYLSSGRTFEEKSIIIIYRYRIIKSYTYFLCQKKKMRFYKCENKTFML